MENPTQEQEAIREVFRARKISLLVEAGAGCAKTSTLKWAAAGSRDLALALAFNKKIAEDLQKALPQSCLVKTFNALGHRVWAQSLGRDTKITLDNQKLGRICTTLIKKSKIEKPRENWENLLGLVTAALRQGLAPQAASPATWLALADNLGIFEGEIQELWPLASEALDESIAQSQQGLLSFDDQIYCPTVLGGVWPRYPTIIIDEDQDLSPLNIKMIQKCAAGRIVAFGDSRQAIYAFRGASGSAAEDIKGLRPKGTFRELPLLTTFRCPKVIVERQKDHLPGFRAAPSAPIGQVISLLHTDWNWPKIASLAFGKTLAVLCRNNAPIISLAFRLLRRGISVQVLGRDFGKGLLTLIKKIEPLPEAPISQVLGKFTQWKEKELAKAAGQEEKILTILDKSETIFAIAEATELSSQRQLVVLLEKLFSQENGKIILSSIHKAKGLEWDTVVHLDPWRIPAKFSLGKPIALAQEKNLLYVAETRTKHTLILASLHEMKEA